MFHYVLNQVSVFALYDGESSWKIVKNSFNLSDKNKWPPCRLVAFNFR